MNIERLALRRSLIAFLHDTCPALVEAMKRARHLYPGDDSAKNAHHLEDTVWMHTLLGLQATLEREDFGLTDILTALVHDFGKPATQVVRPRKSGPCRRHSFSGHGPVGVQTAVDFLDALARAGVLDVPDEDVARIAFATSLHLQFLEDPGNALRFCNDDWTYYLQALSRLLHCDLQGSVGDTESASFGGAASGRRGKAFPRDGRGKRMPFLPRGRCPRKVRAPSTLSAETCPGRAHLLPQALPGGAACSIGKGADVLDLPMPLVLQVLKETPRRLEQGRHFRKVRTRLKEGLARDPAVEGVLCTRTERKSLAGFLKTLLPECTIACTHVLSREHDLLDPKTEFSTGLGTVGPNRDQVLPCLHHEPNLATARLCTCERPTGRTGPLARRPARTEKGG